MNAQYHPSLRQRVLTQIHVIHVSQPRYLHFLKNKTGEFILQISSGRIGRRRRRRFRCKLNLFYLLCGLLSMRNCNIFPRYYLSLAYLSPDSSSLSLSFYPFSHSLSLSLSFYPFSHSLSLSLFHSLPLTISLFLSLILCLLLLHISLPLSPTLFLSLPLSLWNCRNMSFMQAQAYLSIHLYSHHLHALNLSLNPSITLKLVCDSFPAFDSSAG